MSGTNAKILVGSVSVSPNKTTVTTTVDDPNYVAAEGMDGASMATANNSSKGSGGQNKGKAGSGKDGQGAGSGEPMSAEDQAMFELLKEISEKAISQLSQDMVAGVEMDVQKVIGELMEDAKNSIKKEIVPLLQAHAEKLVLDRLAAVQPLQVTITDPITREQSQQLYTGIRHSALEELIDTYNCGHKNIYLQGPAGAGKTTLAMTFAKILKAQFGGLSCTRGMSESWLLGRMLHDGSFVSTMFVEIYENGGVFLLDEVDALDSNMALVINQALEQGILPLPNRRSNPLAKRHPNAVVIGAANDWGRGASLMYTGREPQDAAFVDRFMGAYLHVDYDLTLEESMLGIVNKPLLDLIWNIRDHAKKNEMPVVAGTRMVRAAAMWSKHNPQMENQEILRRLTRPWSADVRARIGHVCCKDRNYLLNQQEALLFTGVDM